MSANMREMVFDDITPIAIPVKIQGKDYVLKEASGEAACRWRNSVLKATKLGPEGKPQSIDGIADSEPLLVSLCLVQVSDKGEKPVTIATIRSWPNRVQKALFDRIKEISELDEKETVDTLKKRIVDTEKRLEEMAKFGESAEDIAKNSPDATMDGSV